MDAKFLLAALMTLLAKPASSAGILLNGYTHEGEWAGAVTLHAGPEGRVEALKDGDFLYLRLTRAGHPLSGADLYVGRGSERAFMVHVSSALSEDADLSGQTQYEAGVWGQNRDWTANTVTVYQEDGKVRVVNPEALEYQFALGKLPASGARLMFVLKRPETRLPAEADLLKTERWLPLDLARIPLREPGGKPSREK
ncbi:hypothetical protein HPC49_23360 [Pyxidicoccus fallax]|uniref:Lipoprotein n=1 Tax=Pyxidicoccus fallax TaxID=394095 RepID=A0A848LJE1_9BACT|nr:hypothetical protein [Pyxidicoccus fallax]NMO17865.1 hypothetical protein [Pyxidicoccus fallax]NPC81153.1 hypothetical protein [Pyxidicoccus fallax]